MVKVIDSGPDWLAAEMPPGYNTRLQEIQRLSEELQAMARFGRLLWTSGEELAQAVRDTFAAARFETSRDGDSNGPVVVTLDGHRRLLLLVVASPGPIQKKDALLSELFQVVRELAGESDRVVLAVNNDPSLRPADRQAPLDAEALKLVQRLGVNVVTTPALFALWSLSLQDRERARHWVDRLHDQDGGVVELSSPVHA